jgi:chromosome segregation ATPase
VKIKRILNAGDLKSFCIRNTKKLLLIATFATNPLLCEFAYAEKAAWYRYYDSRGIANISSTVTQAHIRHGYEALDKNMQVIKRSQPYYVEEDLKQAPQREAKAKQQENDAKLKKAYNNSKVATQKRDVELAAKKKQITLQQQQLKQLQQDRVQFKRDESDYIRKGKPVPKPLKTTLDNNDKAIHSLKDNIQSLQTSYTNTQTEYNKIIQRLKEIE